MANVFQIYYDHWGKHEITERRRHQAVNLLRKKLQEMAFDKLEDLIDLFDGEWVDEKDAFDTLDDICHSLLADPIYSRKPTIIRLYRSWGLTTPRLIYKLRINNDRDTLRYIDAIVALV